MTDTTKPNEWTTAWLRDEAAKIKTPEQTTLILTAVLSERLEQINSSILHLCDRLQEIEMNTRQP